jgi:XRE family aerobic/anaerobic benzoate catabolism transcriptional regulator
VAENRVKSAEKTVPLTDAKAEAFVGEVGRMVRLGRAKRGITRKRLAEHSGISERYLAQIESGQGNPSVTVLRALADAFDMPVADLLPAEGKRDVALARIADLLRRLPSKEWTEIAADLERRAEAHAAADRAQRIALVGLRGAGKSTLGRMLAQHLGCPFVELNRMVEHDYGASVSMLIEMSGVATFRRYERACLEKVIAEHERVVIATAGGIVANPESYDLLLARTHGIWVKAQPQEHMARVMEQGDFRPMAQNREAMADLVAILEARRDDYARAARQLDTSGENLDASFEKLVQLVGPLARPA